MTDQTPERFPVSDASSSAPRPETHTESPQPDPTPEQRVAAALTTLGVCPSCGSPECVRLVPDWRALVNDGKTIPIIGCGNPWHYIDIAADPTLAADLAKARDYDALMDDVKAEAQRTGMVVLIPEHVIDAIALATAVRECADGIEWSLTITGGVGQPVVAIARSTLTDAVDGIRVPDIERAICGS